MLESLECAPRRITNSALCLKWTHIIGIGRHRCNNNIGRTSNWESPEYLSEEVVELPPPSKESRVKSELPLQVNNGYCIVVKAREQWSSVQWILGGVW